MKKLIGRTIFAAFLVAAAVPSFAQFCPGCIQNSATPQNATFNLTQGATIQGTLTLGNLVTSSMHVGNLTVSSVTGSGYFLTNLNASQLLNGTVPLARLSGNYSGITGLGTITSGVWQGTPLGTQYGGTGQNFASASAGSLVYFSSVGTMGTLLPGSPQQLLQTNGDNPPVWTSAPAVSGANVYGIPASHLVGSLPASIVVSSNSIPYVAGASVIGDIAGNAQNINGTLLQSQIAPGTWSSAYPASSITASGVSAGVYGGPAQLAQVNVHADGRVYAASQVALSVPPSIITTGALPAGVTIPAAQVTAGNLPSNVVASSIAASGVLLGSYGDAARTVTIVPLIDGRLLSVVQQNIALPLAQLNAGTLPGNVLVPAANVQAGPLGAGVIASSLAANGVVTGTYGSSTKSMSANVGSDGRILSVTEYTIPGASSGTVTNDKDNAWTHSQTFLSPSSITVQGNIGAQNISGNAISATTMNSTGSIVGGSSITANAFFGDGSHLTGVTATIPGVTNTRFLQDAGIINSIGWNARTLYGTVANPVASWASGGFVMAANSPINLSGGAGNIVSGASVTASAFFGDGSHLSGITTSGVMVNSSPTWSGSHTFLYPITLSTPLAVAQGGTGQNNGTLHGSSGVNSLDFFNRTSQDAGAVLSTDWQNRLWFDPGQVVSGNYALRELRDSVGFPVLGWTGPGIAFSTYLNVVSSVNASGFFGDGSGLSNVTASISPGYIDTSKLATDAVTNVKILNAAVTTAKIAALAVDTSKLATDSVITSKVINGAITAAKLDTAYLPLAGGTITGSLSVPNSSVTANAFFGDGSHLSGIISGITYISTNAQGVAISTNLAVNGLVSGTTVSADIFGKTVDNGPITFSTTNFPGESTTGASFAAYAGTFTVTLQTMQNVFAISSFTFTTTSGNANKHFAFFVDGVQGPLHTIFKADGNPFISFQDTFTLTAGQHTFAIACNDNGGNTSVIVDGDNTNPNLIHVTYEDTPHISKYFGDGSALTGTVEQNTYASSKTFTSSVLIDGLLSGSNAVFSGTVTATNFNAVASNYKVDGVTVINSARNITGNNITATTFFGDGSNLSGLISGITFISTSTQGVAISSNLVVSGLTSGTTVSADIFGKTADNGPITASTTNFPGESTTGASFAAYAGTFTVILNSPQNVFAISSFTFTTDSGNSNKHFAFFVDGVQGPLHTIFKADGNPFISFQDTFTLTAGQHTFAIACNDNGGNTSVIVDGDNTNPNLIHVTYEDTSYPSKYFGNGSFLSNADRVKTKSQLDAVTPALGDWYVCSNCTVPYDICTATGTTLSSFRATLNSAINTVTPGTLVSKGCGTNQ